MPEYQFPIEQLDRLDRILTAQLPNLSRAQVQRLISAGAVKINGRVITKSSEQPKVGGKIEIAWTPEPSLEPSPLPLTVVYEDAELIVIDKPAGLVVHPGAGEPGPTLAAAVVAHWPDVSTVGDPERPGIVHRLDKDTSGLMVIVRTEPARRELLRQFAEREVEKDYVALVEGGVSSARGLIDAPLGRDRSDVRRIDVRLAREARTRFSVRERLNNGVHDYTLLDLRIETGRTHQIRVHLKAIGHPVIADLQYGHAATHLARQFLHAAHLGLIHPRTGERIEWTSPLPADLEATLTRLRAGDEP